MPLSIELTPLWKWRLPSRPHSQGIHYFCHTMTGSVSMPSYLAKLNNVLLRRSFHRSLCSNNSSDNLPGRQQAGLPLYPPELCLLELLESQHGQNTVGNNGDRGLHDFLQEYSYEIHDTVFDSLNENQGVLSYVLEEPDIAISILLEGLDSGRINGNGFYPFDLIQDHTSDDIAQSFGYHPSLDPGPFSQNSLRYSLSLSNGNSSPLKPTFEAEKLELSSLQYPETDFSSWGTSSPPPLHESVDAFISAFESDSFSPYNSDLLDALLDQAKTLSSSKNQYSDESLNSSTLHMYETEWEDYADFLSPFGATSILNECHGVVAKGNSLDELPAAQKFIDWLGQCSGCGKNQAIMIDSISTLLGDDLTTEYTYMTAETSPMSQVWGLDPCTWNNKPAV